MLNPRSNILIVGLGYVGLSNALLFSRQHNVTGYDISTNIISILQSGKLHLHDKFAKHYYNNNELNLTFTSDIKNIPNNINYAIICTPTDFDEKTNSFDTSIVEDSIITITTHFPDAVIVVKSTIPVGFIKQQKKLHGNHKILFAPEFLREGRALEDSLNPTRIIISDKSNEATDFGKLLNGSLDQHSNIIQFVDDEEAELIKLSSNTYLAMRVAFFNEIDSLCINLELNPKDVISGVCADPRIGNYYNNPSFGYGGYCLPKDTKQLLSHYKKTPQNLISAIVDSNETRAEFIANTIIEKGLSKIGIYKLSMKTGSDNHRMSSILSVCEKLKKSNIDITIYDESLSEHNLLNIPIEKDFQHFANQCDLILANRIDNKLEYIRQKVLTRDIFARD